VGKYKISGTVSEPCTVYVFQNEQYEGRYLVSSAGSYSTVFEADAAGDILTFAKNQAGEVVSFGEVTAINDSGTITISGAEPRELDGGGSNTNYGTMTTIDGGNAQ